MIIGGIYAAQTVPELFKKYASVYLFQKCSVKSKLYYNNRKQMEIEVVRQKAVEIYKLTI